MLLFKMRKVCCKVGNILTLSFLRNSAFLNRWCLSVGWLGSEARKIMMQIVT
jgi:hypothetical protein